MNELGNRKSNQPVSLWVWVFIDLHDRVKIKTPAERATCSSLIHYWQVWLWDPQQTTFWARQLEHWSSRLVTTSQIKQQTRWQDGCVKHARLQDHATTNNLDLYRQGYSAALQGVEEQANSLYNVDGQHSLTLPSYPTYRCFLTLRLYKVI